LRAAQRERDGRSDLCANGPPASAGGRIFRACNRIPHHRRPRCASTSCTTACFVWRHELSFRGLAHWLPAFCWPTLFTTGFQTLGALLGVFGVAVFTAWFARGCFYALRAEPELRPAAWVFAFAELGGLGAGIVAIVKIPLLTYLAGVLVGALFFALAIARNDKEVQETTRYRRLSVAIASGVYGAVLLPPLRELGGLFAVVFGALAPILPVLLLRWLFAPAHREQQTNSESSSRIEWVVRKLSAGA